ncbi:hypothetical protein ILUMI_15008 [Ignelater luminosus]|uniref:CCHC-type domain-containing protein n=1 Tax=Ignelater luminosus TaxID=2038154 RepID=A0A8K0G4A6_IGNLU|nr:hypothetical protein ILUMI_15008 [Ignelater luminosus]
MMKLLADMMKAMENSRISTKKMVSEVIKTKNDTEKFHIMPDLSKSIENYDGEIEKGRQLLKFGLKNWYHQQSAAKSWYNSNIPELNTWENFKDRFEKTFCMEASLTDKWNRMLKRIQRSVNENVMRTTRKETTEKKIEEGKGVSSKAERTSYKCGEKGHYKSECKNKEVKKIEQKTGTVMTVNKIQRQVVRQDLESEMLEGDVKNVKVKEVASKIENLYRPVMVNDEVKLYGYGCDETVSEEEVTEGSTEEEAIEREEQSEVRSTGSEKGQSETISDIIM